MACSPSKTTFRVKFSKAVAEKSIGREANSDDMAMEKFACDVGFIIYAGLQKFRYIRCVRLGLHYSDIGVHRHCYVWSKIVLNWFYSVQTTYISGFDQIILILQKLIKTEYKN